MRLVISMILIILSICCTPNLLTEDEVNGKSSNVIHLDTCLVGVDGEVIYNK